MSWWPPWPTIRPGHENHPVTTARLSLRTQSRLVEELAGWADLPYDENPDRHEHSVYDDTVEGGVRALQRAKGLTVDGVIGERTWPALVLTVRKGDKGDAVLAVQHEYAYRDQSSGEGPGLARDGIFGPKTEAWVKGFQQAVELEPDGVVGPKTWRALVSGALAG